MLGLRTVSVSQCEIAHTATVAHDILTTDNTDTIKVNDPRMVHNLKAGLVATTTMVGSAMAYNKAQTGPGDNKEGQTVHQDRGHTGTQEGGYNGPQDKGQGWIQNRGTQEGGGHAGTRDSGQTMQGYQTEGQGQGEGAKYKDTFHQMMMWRY